MDACFGVSGAEITAGLLGLGGEGVAGYGAYAFEDGVVGAGVCCDLGWG